MHGSRHWLAWLCLAVEVSGTSLSESAWETGATCHSLIQRASFAHTSENSTSASTAVGGDANLTGFAAPLKSKNSSALSALQRAKGKVAVPGKQIWRDLAGVALPSAPEDMYGLSRRRRSTDLHFAPFTAAHVDDQLAAMKMAAYNLPMAFDLDKRLPMPGSEFSFRPGQGLTESVTQVTSQERTVQYKAPKTSARMDPDSRRKFRPRDHGMYQNMEAEDMRFPLALLASDQASATERTVAVNPHYKERVSAAMRSEQRCRVLLSFVAVNLLGLGLYGIAKMKQVPLNPAAAEAAQAAGQGKCSSSSGPLFKPSQKGRSPNLSNPPQPQPQQGEAGQKSEPEEAVSAESES
mmetsp:Transcript_54139/g.128910  ORF Transcript_54139/g.128910 Transcript_54139/m.128910 type:complete len:351 (+) Transcript_54139:163-1215(+)|eukprot:CAMPEP_0178416510 /NCGR_PEP_ID=MMETSP0689_2-20121128/24100_1 /TAXON_ID=160604 /ORGANISM="Amphidinium massartii, Strain CS-259" /LENGTH=350 /DNA_ID=CAMNT_0020037855 /DNA_START=95 /DNA_END=1147 /DNA_ORIENTATION=+